MDALLVYLGSSGFKNVLSYKANLVRGCLIANTTLCYKMLGKDRLQHALVCAGVVLSSKVRRKISAELMEGGSQQL